MSKNICLRAYCNENLGDDLFIKAICNRYYCDIFFLVLPRKFIKKFSAIKNLKCIPYDNNVVIRLINRIWRILTKSNHDLIYLFPIKFRHISEKCDLNVLISGSFFIENDRALVRKKTKFEKWYFSLRPFVIGTNFGPFTNQSFFRFYENLFKEARYVCFRDLHSANLFSNLANVNYGNDIVFSISDDFKKNINHKYCAISLINPKKKGLFDETAYQSYLNKIQELIKKTHDCFDYFVLVCFCKNEGDDEAAEYLKDIICDEDVRVHKYSESTIDETLSLLSNSSYIVASRYHAMILALRFNKPLGVISYSSKIDNVISDLNIDLPVCKIGEDINPIILDIVENRHHINRYDDSWKNHFVMLDDLLVK